MVERTHTVLYDQSPIWARLLGWLLVGIGGIVLIPLTFLYRAWWLLTLALPLLIAGLVLLCTRLHIVLDRRTGLIQVTNYLCKLRLHQRAYPRSEFVALDLHRVAGAKRERPSDTYYLRLRFRLQSYTIGRFDDRLSALQAQEQIRLLLSGRHTSQTSHDARGIAEERVSDQPHSAEAHYQLGLALMRASEAHKARQAFERALQLTHHSLLRRMIEQRLDELPSDT